MRTAHNRFVWHKKIEKQILDGEDSNNFSVVEIRRQDEERLVRGDREASAVRQRLFLTFAPSPVPLASLLRRLTAALCRPFFGSSQKEIEKVKERRKQREAEREEMLKEKVGALCHLRPSPSLRPCPACAIVIRSRWTTSTPAGTLVSQTLHSAFSSPLRPTVFI